MLESGVGRAQNIAMSTLPGFTMPGDVSASKRYWHEDIIVPEVEVTSRGTIPRPTGAGIGYRVNEARIESLTVRKDVIVLVAFCGIKDHALSPLRKRLPSCASSFTITTIVTMH